MIGSITARMPSQVSFDRALCSAVRDLASFAPADNPAMADALKKFDESQKIVSDLAKGAKDAKAADKAARLAAAKEKLKALKLIAQMAVASGNARLAKSVAREVGAVARELGALARESGATGGGGTDGSGAGAGTDGSAAGTSGNTAAGSDSGNASPAAGSSDGGLGDAGKAFNEAKQMESQLAGVAAAPGSVESAKTELKALDMVTRLAANAGDTKLIKAVEQEVRRVARSLGIELPPSSPAAAPAPAPAAEAPAAPAAADASPASQAASKDAAAANAAGQAAGVPGENPDITEIRKLLKLAKKIIDKLREFKHPPEKLAKAISEAARDVTEALGIVGPEPAGGSGGSGDGGDDSMDQEPLHVVDMRV